MTDKWLSDPNWVEQRVEEMTSEADTYAASVPVARPQLSQEQHNDRKRVWEEVEHAVYKDTQHPGQVPSDYQRNMGEGEVPVEGQQNPFQHAHYHHHQYYHPQHHYPHHQYYSNGYYYPMVRAPHQQHHMHPPHLYTLNNQDVQPAHHPQKHSETDNKPALLSQDKLIDQAKKVKTKDGIEHTAGDIDQHTMAEDQYVPVKGIGKKDDSDGRSNNEDQKNSNNTDNEDEEIQRLKAAENITQLHKDLDDSKSSDILKNPPDQVHSTEEENEVHNPEEVIQKVKVEKETLEKKWKDDESKYQKQIETLKQKSADDAKSYQETIETLKEENRQLKKLKQSKDGDGSSRGCVIS